MSVSPDGALLVTASEDRSARAWALPDLRGLRVLPHDDYAGGAAFSPDGGRVATAGVDGVRIWSTSTWELVGRIERSTFTVAWGPSGIAVAPRDLDVVELFDPDSFIPLRTFTGHAEPVLALSFSDDGSWLATGSMDRTARLWDVATAQEIRAFVAHKAGVIAVDLTSDASRLVTGSLDKTGRLWDVPSGEPMRLLSGHSDWVTAVAFRTGDDIVLTAGRDGHVRLWDARTGSTVAKMEVDEGAIEDARFVTADRVVAAGTRLHVRDVGELLLDHEPGDPGRFKPLQTPCARLVACGVALARGGGEHSTLGVEAARRARELDVDTPDSCTTELEALVGAIGPAAPEPCS